MQDHGLFQGLKLAARGATDLIPEYQPQVSGIPLPIPSACTHQPTRNASTARRTVSTHHSNSRTIGNAKGREPSCDQTAESTIVSLGSTLVSKEFPQTPMRDLTRHLGWYWWLVLRVSWVCAIVVLPLLVAFGIDHRPDPFQGLPRSESGVSFWV